MQFIAVDPDSRGYAFGFMCSRCDAISWMYIPMKECDYEYCPYCGEKADDEHEDNKPMFDMQKNMDI